MLLVLSGKTASGKDTIVLELLKKYPSFKKVLTSTSRTARNGEQNGVDYNFISTKEFKLKIDQGNFLEYVEYGGNFYGTEKSQINISNDLIWKIDPSMAGKAKGIFPDCLIIYINTDDQTILKRLKSRGLSEKEIEKRMQDDKKFWDLYHAKYNFIIENIPGRLEKTIEKISSLLRMKGRTL